ncbi:MAG: hypothetical protein AB4206_19600, partial [Xenococcaceae cyanobacterium]
KLLLYKDLMSKLSSLTGDKSPVSFFIQPINEVGFQTAHLLCKSTVVATADEFGSPHSIR